MTDESNPESGFSDPFQNPYATTEQGTSDEVIAEAQPTEEAIESKEESVEEVEQAATSEQESPELEEEAEPIILSFELDGQTIELTESEARNGYLRNEDYTRKNQARAEAEREFATEKEEWLGQVNDYLGQQEFAMYAITDSVAHLLDRDETAWDKLKSEDITTYEEERLAVSEASQKYNAVNEKYLAGLELVSQEQAKAIEKQTIESATKLQEAIPELLDPSAKYGDKLMSYATDKVGYTQEELQRPVNHKDWVVLNKAMKYDALMAKKESLPHKEAKKVATKTLSAGSPKPEASSTQKRKQALDKIKEDGRRGDNKKAVEDFFADYVPR